MDLNRAQEILNSSETIEVLYQGKPVWINNINPADQRAYITTSTNPKENTVVDIKDLVEGKSRS